MGKKTKSATGSDEMQANYDFSRGVRAKHRAAYQSGHQVRIHKTDGTIVIQNCKLEEGAVVLAQDVREFFPDSEAVNRALRALIGLIPLRRSRTSSK